MAQPKVLGTSLCSSAPRSMGIYFGLEPYTRRVGASRKVCSAALVLALFRPVSAVLHLSSSTPLGLETVRDRLMIAADVYKRQPEEGYKTAAFCSMCGPKFCSMNYSSKVDEYNKQVHGLEKKDYSELVEKFVTIK